MKAIGYEMETIIPKLYHIQSEPSHFYTGHLKDGTQSFASLDGKVLLAVFFDADGRFLEYKTKELSPETLDALNTSIAEKTWAEFAKDWEELEQWIVALGIKDKEIVVQKFSLPQFELSIQDLPSVYQKILDEGSELDEETSEQIRDWRQVNDFVLVWGNEYDIAADGHVIST